MREIPEPVKRMIDKYGDEFKEIFNTELNHFVSKLWIIGIADFDIVKFDKYMETRRSYEEKDMSLIDYVRMKYGEKGSELINELIDMES